MSKNETDSRRLAIMHVPRELIFFHLFNHPANPSQVKVLTPKIVYRKKVVDWRACEIVDVAQDWGRGTFAFKLRSLEFAPVMAGEQIEYCGYEFEHHLVRILPNRSGLLAPPSPPVHGFRPAVVPALVGTLAVPWCGAPLDAGVMWTTVAEKVTCPQCRDEMSRQLIDEDPSDPGKTFTPEQEAEMQSAAEKLLWRPPTFADIMQAHREG